MHLVRRVKQGFPVSLQRWGGIALPVKRLCGARLNTGTNILQCYAACGLGGVTGVTRYRDAWGGGVGYRVKGGWADRDREQEQEQRRTEKNRAGRRNRRR